MIHWIDASIIAVYVIGIIVMGLWIGRGQRNARDYFLGNRNLSWWGVGLSIVATETSALTFISVPAMAFGGNMTFIQIVIGYVVGRILLAIFLVPHYFSGDVYSPYQLLTRAFGSGAGRTCAGIFLIAGTLAAGVRVYATSLPLHLMADINISEAIVLFIVLSLAYMYVGGIKSVIWTETVQFFLFVGGGIFTICYIPTLLTGSFSENWELARAAGKIHWLNWEWTWNVPFNIWMGLIGGAVVVLSSHGADQLIVQRVLTCRNARDGRKALILSAVLILPLFLIFLFCGLFLWLYYNQQVVPPELPNGKVDYVFPLFILDQMPVGIKGFLLVAIFAAAMSSVASALSALSSVSIMDFVKPLLGKARPDGWFLKAGKISTLVWAALLIVVAEISKNQPLIFDWAFSLSGLTSGAMLGGLVLALYARKTDSRAVIVGMLGSVALMITMQVSGVKWFAWPWFTLLGCLLATGIATLFSLMASKPNLKQNV